MCKHLGSGEFVILDFMLGKSFSSGRVYNIHLFPGGKKGHVRFMLSQWRPWTGLPDWNKM